MRECPFAREKALNDHRTDTEDQKGKIMKIQLIVLLAAATAFSMTACEALI